jgi:hypothetical protein
MFHDYFPQNIIPLTNKISQLQIAITAMYPWIPLGTACGSHGIHGNHCHKDYGRMRCDAT